MRAGVLYKSRALAGCGGVRSAAAVSAGCGGVKRWQWGWALLITSTAAHAYRNSKPQLRMRIPAIAKPGLRRAKGPRVCGWCGDRGVLIQVPTGADLLVPAGVLRSAGRSPWPVYPQARSPGLRRAKGPQVCGWCGDREVLIQVPTGADLLVPAGVLRSAGRSPWPVPGRRLETSVYFRI